MYKVKTWNVYQIKSLLEYDNTNFENFYKEELIQFLNFAREYIKELNQKIKESESNEKNNNDN